MRRDGFSLIELVLAIVIIAISLMSVPMLLSQSSKSNEYSLIQESVMAARTKIGNILTFQWDNNSTSYDVNHPGTIDGVLVMDVQNGDSELNRVVGSSFRKGHVLNHNKGRRRLYITPNPCNALAIGHENVNDFDDIDDFDGQSISVMLTDGAGIAGSFDYLSKNELNITSKVSFLLDKTNYSQQKIKFSFDTSNTVGKNAANSTNIKMIELSVKNAYSTTPFILRAFSSNIGSISKLYSQEK